MIVTKAGTVESIVARRSGAQEIAVRVDTELRPAINYRALTGPVEPGDRVIVNTTAIALKLGTGGFDFVIHVDRPQIGRETTGRHMKLRYTPLQVAVSSAEETYSSAMPRDLGNIPVVACGLHSQISPVCFAIKTLRPNWRVVYVMTDSAALAVGFSRTVAMLREAGWLASVISCGQAFGGDLEAVNLYSGLLLARGPLKADAIVVGQGPGNMGTGTTWGFSGIDQAIALNAATTLGGRPICCLRISFADDRPRHQGVSHHTQTVLCRGLLGRCDVAVPKLPAKKHSAIVTALEHAPDRCRMVVLPINNLLAHFRTSGLPASTMSRNVDGDPVFFMAALAAGAVAAEEA